MQRKGTTMNLKELYDSNDDFNEYVKKYCHATGKSVEQALRVAIVKEYAQYITDKKEGKL